MTKPIKEPKISTRLLAPATRTVIQIDLGGLTAREKWLKVDAWLEKLRSKLALSKSGS
jgi:hypothetical protein